MTVHLTVAKQSPGDLSMRVRISPVTAEEMLLGPRTVVSHPEVYRHTDYLVTTRASMVCGTGRQVGQSKAITWRMCSSARN